MILRVSRINKSNYIVYHNGEYLEAQIAGTLRLNKENKIVVGDFVDVKQEDNKYIIHKLSKRKNFFIRPNIANVDEVFIISSLTSPNINLLLLDKMITLFQYSGKKPILIFTKVDLIKKNSEVLSYVNEYKENGFTTIIVDNQKLNQATKKEILKLIDDKFVVFTGQSGVGKSTLLNNLFSNLSLKTSNISENTQRGKHTTTSLNMINISNKTFVVDTPGFTSFSLEELSLEEIAWNFFNFENFAGLCKFKGCLHIKESNCKIRENVDTGKLSKEKYKNYLSIIEERKKIPKKY